MKSCILILFFLRVCLGQDVEQVGDLNQDSQINVQDVIVVLNIILFEEYEPTEYQLWAADVNVDQEINIQDIVIIVSVIMGTCEECGEYQAYCPDNLTICCYEITSHEIEWEIDLLGGAEGDINVIRDGYIISEDDIWLVGELHDDPEPGSPNYNMVHWDGETWTKIGMVPDNYDYSMYFLKSVFGFSSMDLWVSSGLPTHFNGEEWYLFTPDDDGFPSGLGAMRKIWGSSSSDMFFGKYSGDIIHWDGFEFEIMPTSTGTGSQYDDPTPVHDLWGTGPNNVWAIVKKEYQLGEDHPITVMHYDGIIWEDLYVISEIMPEDGEVSGTLYNGWAFEDTLYLVSGWYWLWKESISTGVGFYDDMDITDINEQHVIDVDMDGNHYNDVYTVGWTTKYAHWNGESWHHGYEIYDYFEELGMFARCRGMDVQGHTIILWGDCNAGGSGWVARGTRN